MSINLPIATVVVLLVGFFFLYVFLAKRLRERRHLGFGLREGFQSNANSESSSNSTSAIPKKIFTYWNEKEITNPVIKANIEYTRSILPSDFELIVLNDESVRDELGEDIRYKDHDMSTPQNFSDFLRFYLLRKYGGIWMDASYIIIDFEEDILSKYRDYDASPFDIGLYEYKKQTFGEKPYEKHYESWFLIAPKGSQYIDEVYQEFVKASTIGYRDYKIGLLREPGLDLRNTIQGEGQYYFMVYAIMRHVLHRRGDSNPFPIKLYQFDKVIYDKWHGDELVAKLMDPYILRQYTSIKLIHNQREALAKSGKAPYLFHLLKNL